MSHQSWESDGMVAVVQGLKDARLAVTLLDAGAGGVVGSTQCYPENPITYDMEVNTDPTPVKYDRHAGNLPYTKTNQSSQSASGKMEWTNEYRQPTIRNFAVPQDPIEISTDTVPQHLRSSQDSYYERASKYDAVTLTNKGTSSRDHSFFMKSLRRYPSQPGSPPRMRASDLVQRLTALTNSSGRRSPNLLPRKTQSPPDLTPTRLLRDSDKNTQTYCRISRIRSKLEQMTNVMANKPSGVGNHRTLSKGVDAYLCSTSQCFEESLRQMCEQSTCTIALPPPCQPSPSCQPLPPCQPPQPRFCSFCNKPLPPCKAATLSCKRTSVPEICNSCKLTPQQLYSIDEESDFYDNIYQWAQEIPVYPNECPKGKKFREAMICSLGQTLHEMRGEDPGSFIDKAREGAQKLLDGIPMWLPEGNEEKAKFKEDLVESLLERLRKFTPNSQGMDHSNADDRMSRIKEIKAELTKIIHEELHEILQQADIELDDDVEYELTEILAGQILRGEDPDDTRMYVSDVLHQTTNLSPDEITTIVDNLVARANDITMSLADSDDLEDKLRDEIHNFTMPYISPNTTTTEGTREAYAMDLAHKTMDIYLEPDKSSLETNTMMRDELSQFARNLSISSKERSQFVDDLAKRLDNIATSTPMRRRHMVTSTPLGSDSNLQDKYMQRIKEIIISWLDSLPIDINKESSLDLKGILTEDILTNVVNRQQYKQMNPNSHESESDELECLKYQIFNKINGKLLPNDVNAIIPHVESLMKLLKSVKMEDLKNDISNIDDDDSLANKSNLLFSAIEKWCDNLPLTARTAKDKQQNKKVKQDLASKMINKIGRLHMDPAIVNNDDMYMQVVEDEVDILMNELPQSQKLEENKNRLKTQLLEKVKKSQQKTKEELVEQQFSDRVHKVVYKTLPSTEKATPTQQVALDVARQDLMDAFLNMQYEADNNLRKELKATYDAKLKVLVDKFKEIDPSTDLNEDKISKSVKAAVKDIHESEQDLLQAEVERARIREEIKQWASNLPLNNVPGPEEQNKTNNMITMAAKRLNEIEKAQELHPENNYDAHIDEEIDTLIRRLPIQNGQEAKHEEIKDNLKRNLQNTKERRRKKAVPQIDSTDNGTATDLNEDADTCCYIPPCMPRPCYNTRPKCTRNQPCHNMSRFNPCISPFPCEMKRSADANSEAENSQMQSDRNRTSQIRRSVDSTSDNRKVKCKVCRSRMAPSSAHQTQCPTCAGVRCPFPTRMFFEN